MEIIKKISKRKAWVRISDTEAVLMTFYKDKTDIELIAEGGKINGKKKRLEEVKAKIKELQHGVNR